MQKSSNPKVVIDTNLLISASIVPNSPPDKLIKAWIKDMFILFSSKEQLEEIMEVSKRKKLKAYPLFTERVEELMEDLAFAAEIANPIDQVPIHSRDPKDDFLIAIALGAKADFLITGDNDLLVIDSNPKLGKLKIRTVKEFLSTINF